MERQAQLKRLVLVVGEARVVVLLGVDVKEAVIERPETGNGIIIEKEAGLVEIKKHHHAIIGTEMVGVVV